MKIQIVQETTLIEALASLSKDSSMSTLRSWLKLGRVMVDGRIEKVAKCPLRPGQKVEVIRRQKHIAGGIEILYEDRYVVAINKPSGLLSVSTDFEKEATAYKILKNHFYPKEIYVVHRLDQETSGVMLFACDEKSQRILKDRFETHDIERRYTAIVEGTPDPEKGVWESYLYEDDRYVMHSTSDPKKGKRAVTHYAVVGQKREYARLDVTLETGKKNQIRVHCQQAGHPVVGDWKYGAESDPIRRLCLHAYHLGFQHPISSQWIRVRSPFPKVFNYLVYLPESSNYTQTS